MSFVIRIVETDGKVSYASEPDMDGLVYRSSLERAATFENPEDTKYSVRVLRAIRDLKDASFFLVDLSDDTTLSV